MVDRIATGPFRVTLPISGARRIFIEKADGTVDDELWLHVEASGPERDSHGDRMSCKALEKMVEYCERGYDGKPVPFLDGHHRDMLASHLGDIYGPALNKDLHFGFDVKVKKRNPFGVELFEDVLAGKKHGASIAGVVHEAEIEEYETEGYGRLFHDVEIVEVSRTSWPSWRPAFIELLGKNLGKSPDGADAMIARRAEIIEKMRETTEEINMTTESVWVEEDGVMVEKMISPHGWDEKFSVSNTPWTSVKDRSKPCQFAIIKKKKDGEFSKSKSGYPHHMPNCSTINRGGVIGAAVRLIQALKSHWPEIEIPPVASMGAEFIGDEMDAYIEEATRFSREELVYAARHILKHYQRDLKMEPPENLVAIAKSQIIEDAEEAAELIKNLVKILVKDEVEIMNGDQETVEVVEETPAAEEIVETPEVEELQESAEESATETEQETATEPEAEIQPEEEIEAEEVAGETEVESPAEQVTMADSLSDEVEDRMLARKFGVLVSAMSEMVAKNVRKKDVNGAFRALDEFMTLAQDTIKKAVERDVSMWTDEVVSAAVAEKIELEEGRLSKSRVGMIEMAGKAFVADYLALMKVIKNANVEDDTIVERAAQVGAQTAAEAVAQTKSEERLELERRMAAVETRSREQMDEVVRVLSEPEVGEPQNMEIDETADVGPQEVDYTTALNIFGKSVFKNRG